MAKHPQAGKQNKSLLKLIDKYYADLADFARQHVLFEMGTRHAFHRLIADAAKPCGWTLIAEQEKKVGGRTIRPDGTFKDEMNLVRGYWEAKDTADKLDAEIEMKRKAGYPLNNIIFEDTQTAVLYQHGQRILSVEMKAPEKLAELVLQFFRYVEPEIEEFEQAVDEFKERVPDLAEGLQKKIAQAHRTNPEFKRAFGDFFALCQTSLNPNISQAAVDEMLVQHILTERLIREIFNNPEFVRRNVIAAEAFAKAGKKLAALHLEYEQLEPWKLEFVEAPGVPLSYHVDDKMRLSKDKLRLTVNTSLTLAGIPPAALEYRLGNRSALEWVVDQYQVGTDKRSGITSDPNRDDDPEYIVRLVGQVISVSIETVKIVGALPAYSTEKT